MTYEIVERGGKQPPSPPPPPRGQAEPPKPPDTRKGGRPPVGDTPGIERSVTLAIDSWDQIDQLRGTRSRSAMVRELVEEALKARAFNQTIRRAIVEAEVDEAMGEPTGILGDPRGLPLVPGPIPYGARLQEIAGYPGVFAEIPIDPHGANAEQLVQAKYMRDGELEENPDLIPPWSVDDHETMTLGFRCQKGQHERCRASSCECDCHGH